MGDTQQIHDRRQSERAQGPYCNYHEDRLKHVENKVDEIRDLLRGLAVQENRIQTLERESKEMKQQVCHIAGTEGLIHRMEISQRGTEECLAAVKRSQSRVWWALGLVMVPLAVSILMVVIEL